MNVEQFDNLYAKNEAKLKKAGLAPVEMLRSREELIYRTSIGGVSIDLGKKLESTLKSVGSQL